MAAETSASQINLRDLIKAGVHFGHRKRFWHPSFKDYLFGVRNNLHIINLDETKRGLVQASRFCKTIAAANKTLLFVCTKPAGSASIKAEADRCGMPYVNHRWLGGLLSNYETVLQSVKKLKSYEEQSKPESLSSMTKKEGMRLLAKFNKLQANLEGVRNMNALPSALFVIDAKHHKIAIKEANKIGIPIIAVVDSNTSIEGIDVVIPGNDDSPHSIAIYLRCVTDAILAGKASTTAESSQTKPSK